MKRHRTRRVSQGMNFWPGYVDALTNVVLNLLFMVAMFGITIAVFNRMPGGGLTKLAVPTLLQGSAANRAPALVPQSPLSIVPPAPPPVPTAAPAEPGLVVADVFRHRNGPAPAIAQRSDLPSGTVMRFDLPARGDPIGLLNRPGVQTILAKTLQDARGARLWAAADAADPVARKTAYLALITMRNQLISLGLDPNSIDVRVYPGAATAAGGLRVFLASIP